jgi:intracellular septation protein
MAETVADEPRWVRPLTEYVPLGIFFLVYRTGNLTLAIQAIVVVTILSVAISYAAVRRLPVLSLIGAGLVVLFGGASLAIGDDRFFKMKPTVTFVGFSLALLVARAFGRLPLKSLMADTWKMTDQGWQRLTTQYAGFFLFMAAMNELVWRTQTESAWVSYKVFGGFGLMIAFTVSRIPFVKRHALPAPGA